MSFCISRRMSCRPYPGHLDKYTFDCSICLFRGMYGGAVRHLKGVWTSCYEVYGGSLCPCFSGISSVDSVVYLVFRSTSHGYLSESLLGIGGGLFPLQRCLLVRIHQGRAYFHSKRTASCRPLHRFYPASNPALCGAAPGIAPCPSRVR